MRGWMLFAAFAVCGCGAYGQTPQPKFDAFEVATIKRATGEEKGRYIVMQGSNRFIAAQFPVKLLIAAAYELNPKTISGGPAWMNVDTFDIVARTPGDARPTHDEQMKMLRALLVERFGLKFHREQKDFAIYALEIVKGGPKLKPAVNPDLTPVMGPAVVYPQKVVLPGRNATTGDLSALLQRAIVDRPVVDRTGLTGHYDFDLDWAPDETQFGGDVGKAADTASSLPLFAAIQQELGLKLEATHGTVSVMVVDAVERPSQD